jgi:hypothetical protein
MHMNIRDNAITACAADRGKAVWRIVTLPLLSASGSTGPPGF